MDILILSAGNESSTETRITCNFGFGWGEFNITSVVAARNISIKSLY